MPRPGGRWTRVLELALLAWPRDARRRFGPELLVAFEDEVREGELAGFRLWRRVAGEVAAVMREGLVLRTRGRANGIREAAMGWWGDARYAVRGLVRSPAFSATVGLTLALGIGANATVFSIVNQTLFKAPDFENPDALAFVWNTRGSSPERVRVPASDVPRIAAAAPAFEEVVFSDRVVDAAFEDGAGLGAHALKVASVTPSFFRVLGVSPEFGGDFASEPSPATDEQSQAILSYRVWTTFFARDPGVVGRTIRLDGREYPVAGVAPQSFNLRIPAGTGVASRPDVWVSLVGSLSDQRRADGRLTDQDSDNTGVVVGRIRADASLAHAQSQLDRLAAELGDEFPAYAEARIGLSARPLHDDAVADLRGLLMAMLVGVGVLLAVTCMNVAVLLLARGARRAREFTVREALGAMPGRIARQLAAETLVLVAVGMGLAAATSAALSVWLSRRAPEILQLVQLEHTTGALLVVGGLTGLVMLVFGLIPARRRLGSSQAAADLRGTDGRSRVRRAFVGAQMAFSVVLLLATSLLLRTAAELRRVDPGFDTEDALTFSLSLRSPDRYRGPGDRAEVVRELGDRLAALPGVESAGAITQLPLSERRWSQPWGVPGEPPQEWTERRADFRAISSDVFRALGTEFLAGRGFTRVDDLQEERRVVVIDEEVAGHLGGVDRALGASIGIPLDGDAVEATVIGVVERVRYDRLDADGRGTIYVPYRQEASRDVSFVLRTSGRPSGLPARVRDAAQALDPQFAVFGLQTFEAYVDRAIGPTRFGIDVLGIFALLALVAVGIGLYGSVSLEVARQRREIGIRIAIGASYGRVVEGVLRRTAWTIALGVAAGVILAAIALRPLETQLFGTGLGDPRAWWVTVAAISGISILASWIPARRIARVHPTEVLRGD